MILNLLVLPLATGYYVLTRSFFLKYKQQRLNRQRLIFETVIYGVIILIFGFLLRTVIYDPFVTSKVKVFLYNINPLKDTLYSGTVFMTFILTVLFTKITNHFIKKEAAIFKAIKQVGNEFELIASKSFNKRQLVLITLENDKFYIGWVKELPIPSLSNYLRIIPALSGIRDENKRLKFISHYLSAYSEYIEKGKLTNISDLNTDVIIDNNRIVSISYFDYDIYNRLNNKIKK